MVWTVDDIPDQSSKVILITGATSGIGFESARVLASHGAHLVLACRNKEKMAKVADECRAAGAIAVDELVCDTSDLDSVRACAESYSGPPIDVLLLNAGATAGTFSTNKHGHELVFATNHLGHFLLTGLLLEKVKERIVVVSSLAHASQDKIEWESVRGEKPPTKGSMYSQSKLANLLFVKELNRRLVEAGSDVIAVGTHPGFAKTDIVQKIEDKRIMNHVFSLLMAVMGQPGEHGAWPLLMAVTHDEINRDCYYAPSKGMFLSEFSGPPIPDGKKSEGATNAEEAKKLWEESEKLCDFTYSF